jgi:hypothetical protein
VIPLTGPVTIWLILARADGIISMPWVTA